MPKRVLGNDPFERGAAQRPVAPKAADSAPPPRPTPSPHPKRAPPPALRPPKAKAAPDRSPASSPSPGSASSPSSSGPPPSAPEASSAAATGGWATTASVELASAVSVLRGALDALRAGLGSPARVELDVYGGDEKLQATLAPLAEFLYTRWFRVSVEGAEHVPRGGALLVANHAGALPIDGPVLNEVLRRSRPDLPGPRWLVEDQVFYAPVLGTLLNRLGAVRASPENATRLLAEGRPVCVFPEGIQGIGKPYRERYRLKRFGRGGFVKLALRTGVPILPVAIVGGEESLPLLAKLPAAFLGMPYLPITPLGPIPLPAKWLVRIGPPLALPEQREPQAGAPAAALAVVESLVEQTRHRIEEMLQELLRARGTIYFG
jgi:1-acyl-sn-glycerol-3-phosphate acyltransferase